MTIYCAKSSSCSVSSSAFVTVLITGCLSSGSLTWQITINEFDRLIEVNYNKISHVGSPEGDHVRLIDVTV